MKVYVLLADSAQADQTGKIHALGLGWTRTAPITGSMAVIALIQFEPGEDVTGQHDCVLELLEEDGRPAALQVPGREPVHLKLESTVEFKSEPGAPVTAPLVVNLGPGMPLKPGVTYAWRATVDGKTDPTWEAQFATHPVSTDEHAASTS
ncbi:hypothetical protein [Lentzea sp. HUAS12]|uniref:DUF6941 family protein n=1 Tax=Lentzea sp. HUAS12 TaxID=2951806 RepID=UPI00209D538F|nr:hypothetical protein [Lentzea sp. HUAS12]USX50619.1 hypothetical protein ND450_35405 [Lentzea sp. HUAS12]